MVKSQREIFLHFCFHEVSVSENPGDSEILCEMFSHFSTHTLGVRSGLVGLGFLETRMPLCHFETSRKIFTRTMVAMDFLYALPFL